MFALAATKVHADLVTYSMTGTATYVYAWSMSGAAGPVSAPVAVGDRISWTLQYDRTTPALQTISMPGTSINLYSMPGPLVTHLVDLTRGIQLYTPPPGSFPARYSLTQRLSPPFSSLDLTNGLSRGSFLFDDSQSTAATPNYLVALNLSSSRPFSTMNLAQLALDKLPLESSNNAWSSYLGYTGSRVPGTDTSFNLYVQLNSLSPGPTTPEPGTLTLFTLGLAGLAVRRFRCAIVRAG